MSLKIRDFCEKNFFMLKRKKYLMPNVYHSAIKNVTKQEHENNLFLATQKLKG